MTLESLLIKTKGWLLTVGTYATIQQNSDWYDWCPDGTLAWAEQQKIELTGLAAKELVPVPQGWAVQEMLPPRGYCYGLFNQAYPVEPPFPTAENLPWWCEIHDFWTTRELTDAELMQIAGIPINQRSGPAMEGYSGIVATLGAAQAPFMDWEQVIACRSRTWAPTASVPLDYGKLLLNPAARKTFVAKLHDSQWGSMEPIATIDVYHTRLIKTNIDTRGSEEIEGSTGTFCDIPPSIQPMLVEVIKPAFIEKMTMERRSKGV